MYGILDWEGVWKVVTCTTGNVVEGHEVGLNGNPF